jgi:hypothetical protein
MDQKNPGRQIPLIRLHCEIADPDRTTVLNLIYSRWYNVPVESSSSTPMLSVVPAASEAGPEHDSKPINFDTFVPTHNPSLDHLSSLAPPMDYAQDSPGDAMVSQDEAFSRALNAMYWGGYWTAMYHVCILLHLPFDP